MKKFLSVLLISLFFLPFVVKADELVKVYLFESGGCPYCEDEIEYLESLDSYNEKFTIVRKELYIDHVKWQAGKDYKLGVKTVLAFKDMGFNNAAYNGTPFVVISDLYAATAFNSDLEKIILQAYDEKDKDVVGCIEQGNDDCLEGYVDSVYEQQAMEIYEAKLAAEQQSSSGSTGASSNTNYSNTGTKISGNAVVVFVLAIVIVFVVILVINNILSKNIKKQEEIKKALEEEKKEEKVTKKAPIKKTTTTKTSKKTTTSKQGRKTTKK